MIKTIDNIIEQAVNGNRKSAYAAFEQSNITVNDIINHIMTQYDSAPFVIDILAKLLIGSRK